MGDFVLITKHFNHILNSGVDIKYNTVRYDPEDPFNVWCAMGHDWEYDVKCDISMGVRQSIVRGQSVGAHHNLRHVVFQFTLTLFDSDQ